MDPIRATDLVGRGTLPSHRIRGSKPIRPRPIPQFKIFNEQKEKIAELFLQPRNTNRSNSRFVAMQAQNPDAEVFYMYYRKPRKKNRVTLLLHHKYLAKRQQTGMYCWLKIESMQPLMDVNGRDINARQPRAVTIVAVTTSS